MRALIGRVRGGLVALCLVTLGSSGCGGCPQALLSGTLARADDDTAVVRIDDGTTQVVEWPFGYRVDTEPAFSLVDLTGTVVASEGDPIYVGGGSADETDEVFVACGYVSREPPS